MIDGCSRTVQDAELLQIKEKLEARKHFCEVNIEITERLSVIGSTEEGSAEGSSSQQKMTYLRSEVPGRMGEFRAAAEGDVSVEALLSQIPATDTKEIDSEEKARKENEVELKQAEEIAYESLILEKKAPERNDLPGYLLAQEKAFRNGLRQRGVARTEDLGIELTLRTHIQKTVNNQGSLKTDYSERLLVTVIDEKGREYCLSGLGYEELIPELMLARKIDSLPEGSLAAGEYPAVLSALTLNRFLVTMWKCLTKTAYDQNQTPYAGGLDRRVMSAEISLIDRKNASFPYRVDSLGAEGNDLVIIDQGVLRGLLGEGNRGRTFGLVQKYTVSEGPCELILARKGEEETTSETDEKLTSIDLIRRLRDGIYVTEAFDQFHAIDPVSGRFSFPITAVKVEGGELTQVLRGLTMEGTVKELFSSIIAVSDQVRREPLAIIETFMTTAPSCLVLRAAVT